MLWQDCMAGMLAFSSIHSEGFVGPRIFVRCLAYLSSKIAWRDLDGFFCSLFCSPERQNRDRDNLIYCLSLLVDPGDVWCVSQVFWSSQDSIAGEKAVFLLISSVRTRWFVSEFFLFFIFVVSLMTNRSSFVIEQSVNHPMMEWIFFFRWSMNHFQECWIHHGRPKYSQES